jgi:hypothetical protein
LKLAPLAVIARLPSIQYSHRGIPFGMKHRAILCIEPAVHKSGLCVLNQQSDPTAMEKHKSRRSILPVLAAIFFLAIAFLTTYVYFASSVSGTATLPGGLVATINGPFAAAENPGRTSVEASGRTFVFTPSAVVVDGTAVATIDASVTQVAIDVRGRDAELSLNGQPVSLPRR